MLIHMNKWGFQNDGKTTTKKLHQIHYITILKYFNPQRTVYLASEVKNIMHLHQFFVVRGLLPISPNVPSHSI